MPVSKSLDGIIENWKMFATTFRSYVTATEPSFHHSMKIVKETRCKVDSDSMENRETKASVVPQKYRSCCAKAH